MEGERVLITGGAGFVGSNVANRLAGDNDVLVVDDRSLGTPENLRPAVEFHERSVLEAGLPTDVDAVFHFAALSSYAMHEAEPGRGARVNIEGFVNVVEQARQDGCETVVYASTSSVYGDRTTPSAETTAVEAKSGYEASKLARERYAEYFRNHHGLSLAGLRLFSVYGGYGGGESHKGEYANVIAQFAEAIANDEPPVLYGDGTQTRDFVHVSDVVDAAVLAAEGGLDGRYNVGTGERRSFETVVEAINGALETSVDPEYVENPIPESVYVHHTCADASKLREATGWEPEVGFEEGIERVCAAYR
ncbi:NAD-dependent epimerase/dehydratase family protein [Natronomonas sp. F2-12]|jgi:UDP-glucose 4-epimerase|uniref:NAD-dependent epimerase/dehydratase family protein n=1 Tax=Natronomonas aquatica TaxID=2841590 RepID=A0A9R1D5U7_9EURY|nr:NAD-dependent epimerase/dehydratase family protein [Natronomonas aquatica]MCQ4334709.1 NAD-dependent epimerase/dehydratase family protein [Natronomonas aquatica]